MPVQTKIQIRRGTTAEWLASIDALSQGELGYDLSLKKFKVGDGTSLWNGLPWATIIGSDLVGSSGINISYAAGSGVATVSVSGLTSSSLSDFSSAVSGLLPVKNIVAGTNIAVSGNNGTYTISTNGLDTNTVKDTIGSTITGVSGIAFNYNSTAKTATISLSDPTIQSTDVTDFNSAVSGLLGVKSLVQSTGIGIYNNNGIQTISVTGIPSSLISDLSSSIDSAVSTELIGGSGIGLSYNSGSNSLTINTTGVSYTGHSHNWSSITDASSTASLSELAYLSGVVAGTASIGRALVLDSNKDISGIRHLTSTGNVTVGGNLVVQGVTTTVNSTVVEIGDNIIRVNSSGLNTGGFEVYTGTGTKNLIWNIANNRWEFSGGDIYTSGNFIGNASTVTNGVYTTDTGTVTSTMIANDTIVNADINSSAGITYSKLNLSNSITNNDISSSASIAVNKLASSGIIFGSTTANLGSTITSFAGLSSISGTSVGSPTFLYNCVIDGGTP
jgi:hypothetical protein